MAQEGLNQWSPPLVYGPGIVSKPDGEPLRQMLEGVQKQMARDPSEADKAAQAWAIARSQLDDANNQYEIARGRLENAHRAEADAWDRLAAVARPKNGPTTGVR